MESLEVAAAVREYKVMIGGFIQKVYQLDSGKFLFRIHVSGEGKKNLLFKLGKGLYLTERDVETPMTPSHYIMLLRKYLGNVRISNIEQHEFDRVVVFELQGRQTLKLIFELFGKGNLVLVGPEHILLPLKSETWKHRKLKEGETYLYPPSRTQPFKLTIDEVRDILASSNTDIVRTLAVMFNLGGKYAEELCARMGVDKNSEELVELAEQVYEALHVLEKTVFEDELGPRYALSDGTVVDAVPFPLKRYENMETKSTSTYQEALDIAFLEVSEGSPGKRPPNKQERKLTRQIDSIENMKKQVENSQAYAELIYQNYPFCEGVLDNILTAREEGNRDEVFSDMKTKDDVVEINDTDEYVVVKLKGIVDDKEFETNVRLDFRKDVNENAQKYYRNSKKLRKKIEGAKIAVEETKKEIERGVKKDKKMVSKKPTASFWFDRYKWFISSDGNLVVAGKDTKTNEEVVKKYLESNDIYVHAEAGGAPSVVVKSNGEEISVKTLEEACQFAVIHSKEWKRGVATGIAYWVYPDQVSKTAEAGESLPTGAFVIRGKRNFIKDLPMKACIGEVTYDDKRKVTIAPSSVEETVKNSILFIHGPESVNNFSKKMSNKFNVPVTEIQKLMPPGGVRVIEE